MGWHTRQLKRIQAGFTLMELLVVLAIVGVVIAISAPNLAPLFRSMEMNRLDNYAKEMYVAVQDQFISMESTGEFSQFNATLTAAAGERNLGALGAQPPDAPDAAWRNYFYLQHGAPSSGAAGAADEALSAVVARSAIIDGLTRGGRYIIEVSPRSDGTDVYSVFYSEDPNFSYADVQSLPSRSRDDRMYTASGYPVGYYNGLTAEAPEVPDHFSPRARFVNGAELFLKVTCAGGVGLVGSEGSMEMKVTLTDGAATQVLTYQGGQDFRLNANGNLDVDILLDSMRDGLHLADIFPDFTPGADITATVEVTAVYDGATIATPAEARGQAKDNSLYASNKDGSVEVANVRHMNNLQLLPTDVQVVTQAAHIDFDAETWGAGDTTELSQATKDYNEGRFGTPYVNPLDPRTVDGAPGFLPLETAGASWMFDGRGNELRNFYIEGSGKVGLFATIQPDQVVRKVTLVDPTVMGSGNVGALAGELVGSVEDCGVHLGVLSPDDSGKAQTYVVLADSGTGVGGLIGQARANATIARSYAAINVVASGASDVGGLVGTFAGAAIDSSYASGEIDAGDVAGGLVGALERGSITAAYSTSDVYTTGTAGGFIGSATGGSVSEAFAYGRVNSTNGGGFTGVAGASFTNCAYLEQVAYNEGLLAQPDGIEARDYSTLSNRRLAADHSFPYDEGLMGKAFPFANVLDEHWGNWPASMRFNPILAYYERYGDGSYGFYGTGETDEGLVTINTLDAPNGAIAVEEDGYALLSVYSIRGFEYALNGGQSQRVTQAASPQEGSFVDLGIDSISYWNGIETLTLDNIYVYQLPFDLQMPSRTATSFVDMLEMTFADAGGSSAQTYTYYYNPDFAMLSASPHVDGITDEPDTSVLYVRTARQLNRLGYQSAYWAPNAYIELNYDIDYGYYTTDYLGHTVNLTDTTGTYASRPIGTPESPFWGVFNGTNHDIIDYNLYTGVAAAGLFGMVGDGGLVHNTHLAASALGAASVVRSGGTAAGTIAVGGLVGRLQGEVAGCSVSGYQVYADGSLADAAVGGLVGLNEGSVMRSTAADAQVTLVSSASGAILGLGGLTGGTSSGIYDSYAVNNTLTGQGRGAGSVVNQGGIAGTNYSGSAQIANCYGYCFTENSTGGTVAHFDIANPSGCSIQNCYRLHWGDADAGFDTGGQDGSEVVSCTPAELQDANLGSAFAGSATPRATYGSAYYYDSRIVPGHLIESSYIYPYPVVCLNIDAQFCHYGFDWWE